MTLSQILLSIRPVELAEILKKVLRISYREVPIGSRKFWLDPASNFGHRLIRDQYYEPELTARIVALLEPGDTFVDLGTNEGFFSMVAGEAVGPNGQVFSIEPQARLWPVIIKNYLLNQLNNYRLIPYAVGEQEGEIEMRLYPSINTGASSTFKGTRHWLRPVQKTKLLPLTRIFELYRIPKVKVLKIDIEGFELNALRSLKELLDPERIENILVEVHHDFLLELGQSAEQLHELLISKGYRLISRHEVEHWAR